MATFALVAAGSLVTSNDAALSVPDWPLSWGRLAPPLEGGIRYEFAHRVLAAAVALLIFLQAIGTRRKLAWWALAAVLAQALLGGAVVKLVDPKALAVAHASLAQMVFGLTVALAAEEHGLAGWNHQAGLAAAAIFGQTVLGAALRHQALPLWPHAAGAAVATGVVMWVTLGAVVKHLDDGKYPLPAVVLLGLTGAQVVLGMMAYSVRLAAAGDPQPMPLTIWVTVAHVLAGTLAFGAAVVMAMHAERVRQ